MSGENTLTSLNSTFKYVQDKLQSLLPENAKLMNMVPKITEQTREGRVYLRSTQLAHENGFTYGDGGVNTLTAASNAVYGEISLDARPIVLQTVISNSVANRMANGEKSGLNETALRSKVMKNSIIRRYEISMLYGNAATALGTATAAGTANTSTTETVTITAASWSSGIWGGAIGAPVQFFQSAALVSSGADAVFTVTKVNVANKTLLVTGTTTGCTALHSALGGAAVYVAFYGSAGTTGTNGNDMLGLDTQVVGGATFLGIDPTVYPLWQGQTFDCKSASLTMGKVLAGAAECVAVGGLDGKAELHISAATYANLNSDQAALREYDQSYSEKENTNGSDGLKFIGPNGSTIKIVVNNIVKEGEAFLFPVDDVERIGAKEISFNRPGHNDQFFQELPTQTGYQIRCEGEFAVLLNAPAKACKFTGIVNS